jgi:transposase
MSDVETVKRVKKDLRGWKLGRALFVADAGMNSEKNRKSLARACGTYLLAVRAGSIKEVQQKVLKRRGPYHKIHENLKAKEVVLGKGVYRRRYILCLNDAQARRQKKHREVVIAELEKQLASHKDRRATAKWAIKLQASGRYGRYLKERNGKVVINKAAVRKAETMDGKWVVMTNDDTIGFEEAALGYKNLMVIERCFRSLKRTQIRMSPMYHWLPRRIEAHVKICVLALLIERVAELATKMTWSQIQRALEELQVTKYQTEKFQLFERNELPLQAGSILKSLDISTPKTLIGVSRRD